MVSGVQTGKKVGLSFHLNHSFSNLDGWQVKITLAELGIIEWIGKEIGVSRKSYWLRAFFLKFKFWFARNICNQFAEIGY